MGPVLLNYIFLYFHIDVKNINSNVKFDDIYSYDDFVEDIKLIIKKSKVTIVKSSVKVSIKTATWELRLKK